MEHDGRATIRLLALGGFDLRAADDTPIRPVIAQPKRAALLTYLAVARPRGSHSRDTLLALLWPEQDEEHARNALSQAVHFLRRSVGDDVVTSHNGDALAVPEAAIWCDANAFEATLDAGDVGGAVALYRGEFLEGFHVAGAPAFDQWLDAERRRLGERFEDALQTLASTHEKRGDFAAAVPHRRRLAARRPYDSAVALGLMRALAGAGDPADAVRYAQIHERLLRAELDVPLPADIAAYVEELKHPGPASVRQVSNARRGPAHEPAASAHLPQASERARAEPAGSAAHSRSTESGDGGGQRWRVSNRAAVLGAVVLVLSGAGGAAAFVAGERGGDAIDPSELRSLAVLPFEDLSPDTTHRFFSVGLHDAIITELGRHPDLDVRSRTSVVNYTGRQKALPQIARELKVGGIVEGSVQRIGDRVVIHAQLIHGPTDRHVWAERFERELDDVLALQGDLGDAIARQVNVTVLPRTSARAARTDGARDLLLRELILRGKHVEIGRTLEGVLKAKDAYEEVIRMDSTLALGYAALSNLHTVIARYAFAPTRAARDTARQLALKAVRLDSTSSEAHTALAVSLADAHDWVGAEREFQTAIHLNPNDAQAHYWYAMFLAAMARGSESLREIKRSLELDPFASRGHLVTLNSAEYFITGNREREREDAARQWRNFITREPAEPWGYRADAYQLAESGRCAEARAQIARMTQLAPDHLQSVAARVMVEWRCGDKTRARKMLAEAKRHADAIALGKVIAFGHAVMGDRDSTFAWLDRAEWGFSSIMDLRAHRFLDGYREDPRYEQLLRRLGLPNPHVR